MIGNILLLQAFVTFVQARPNHIAEEILNELTQNDANLNPGFDLNAFRTNQLDLHNHYRALHGVPSMTMDLTLQSQAQAYAETLAAADNGLNHCNKNDPNCNGGENLAMASGSTTVETNATKVWYDEVWYYNFCAHSSHGTRPGHAGKDVGHFTQVIWRASTKLGIGYARSSDKTKVYVVGRYLEAGNFAGQFEVNVPKADYLFDTFQNNCDGTNGGLSAWSSPGDCTRSCGGGVRFQTKTCTNPKPSLNGADCSGVTKQLAAPQWCNLEACQGSLSHRDLQCQERGYTEQAHNFGGSNDCVLHCLLFNTTYFVRGNVDDGTHCSSDSGVCVNGVCDNSMPDYVAKVTPGGFTGSYTDTPSLNIWNNDFFTVPNGATNVVITNNDYSSVDIKVGYKSSSSLGYRWGENSSYYVGYQTSATVKGVSFDYQRTTGFSRITIAGPVQPDTGFSLVLYAEADGTSQADISWTYDIS